MKVSVIIPVFNNMNIIDEIKAKILQINKEYEIIIIDDASQDKTYESLVSFKNDSNLENIKILKNEKNKGPSHSRNRGIKEAIGEYIAFLDSDDDWHPQKIDIQIDIMQKYQVLICGTMHKVIDKDQLKNEQSKNYLEQKKLPIREIKWPKILFVTPFATPSVIIHKSLKNFIFDENMKYAEDYNMWKRITYKYKAIKIMVPLTYTFKHDYISKDQCLSANLKKMQDGVNESFIKLMRDKDISFSRKLILPFALVFSYLKYIRRVIKSKQNG